MQNQSTRDQLFAFRLTTAERAAIKKAAATLRRSEGDTTRLAVLTLAKALTETTAGGQPAGAQYEQR